MKRTTAAAVKRVSREQVAGEVAEELLGELSSRVTTLDGLAAFHIAATNVIAEAAAQDAALAEHRENAQHWRQQLPELAEAMGL